MASNNAILNDDFSIKSIIIDLMNNPEKISNFGSEIVKSDITLIDNPHVSDEFIISIKNKLDQLINLHPWRAILHEEDQEWEKENCKPIVRLSLSFYRFFYNSLKDHYYYIKSIEDEDNINQKLSNSFENLIKYEKKFKRYMDTTKENLTELNNFVNKFKNFIDHNLDSLGDFKNEINSIERLKVRLSSLIMQELYIEKQLAEMKIARNKLLLNIDFYYRLNENFIPNYLENIKLLKKSKSIFSIYSSYKFYHKKILKMNFDNF